MSGQARKPRLALCVMMTDSMRPAVEAGDFLLVEKASEGLFQVGDLAMIPAWGKDSSGFVHRVTRILEESGERWLITKGDASLFLDAPTRESAAAGRVVFLGRPDQRWISLDAPVARWGGRLAAIVFGVIATRDGARGARTGLVRLVLAGAVLERANRILGRLLRWCLAASAVKTAPDFS